MTPQQVQDLIRKQENESFEKALREIPDLVNGKTEQGISFLAFAAYCRNSEAVALLRRKRGQLELYEAAIVGDLLGAGSWLERHPELINTFTADGFTPLGLACFFGQLEMARLLIAHGADVNLPSANSFKVAPIHSSCAISSYTITELLLQNGADVNVKQDSDVTPLHEAAHNGKDELVNLLLYYGAVVHAVTTKGQTPYDMAMEKQFLTTASLLQSATVKS